MPLIGLAKFPPFLRFNEVKLWYNDDGGSLAIEEKCDYIESQLLPLKSAFDNFCRVEFAACIDQDDHNDFSDQSQLLEYLHNRLLPILNPSSDYKFYINFCADENSVTNLIESLLQMAEIKSCSNIKIRIGMCCEEQKQLPVEEISNWLERSTDGIENTVQSQKERVLKIGIQGIQNAREIVDHLKMVYFKIIRRGGAGIPEGSRPNPIKINSN